MAIGDGARPAIGTRYLTCEGCGAKVERTTALKCDDCNEEDAAVARVRQAVDDMAQLIEERRKLRRQAWGA